MRCNKKLVSVILKGGRVKRVARGAADTLINGGAKFISKTLYKAAKAGVTVAKGMSDAAIKKAVRAAVKKTHKAEVEVKEPQQRKKRGERSNRDR